MQAQHKWLNLGLALVLIVMTCLTAAVAGPAAATLAATPAAVSPTLNQFGFPNWYQDTTGTRIAPCLDVNDPFCVVLPNPGVFDPAFPMVLPDNFPDEFFYSVVDSDIISTPGCGGTRPGKALLRVALEGAFVNGLPAPNEQMVFGRVRVRVTSGLCPNTEYTFTHPFGTMTLTTNEFGGTRVVDGTQDIGCAPVSPQTCDFSLALRGPVSQSFLRWNPAVAPAAPAGYLGDATTLHTITGATYDPGTGPANYFAIEGTNLSTNQFTVMGKLAGPVLAAPPSVDFGGQDVDNGLTAARSVTLTNIGNSPLTISAIGAAPVGRFVAADGGCIGTPLARDASCSVSVAFDPDVVGELAGTLSITHDGIRSPLTVALAGTGINPGLEAVLSAAPTALNFGNVRIRTQSLAQRIRITNTGTAPLQFTSVQLMDVLAGNPGDSDQFVVSSNACSGTVVQPGKRCDINIAARPAANGAAVAALHIVANISIGHVDIPVQVVGTGGIAAVSSETDTATGYPTWYQDESGIRLSECIDPKDPYCIVLADDFFDPAFPLEGRPDFANFPEEFFYTVADSDIITTPGCGSIPPGRAFVRTALESAFVNPVPTDGDQMVFGRERIVVRGGLCPNTEYTFTYPYGQTKLTTDSQGSIKPAAGTVDIGCFPVAPDKCNFADALQSPVLGSFLQWDPAVAPAAPAGYLGDAVSLHRITGSPFGNNLFRIEGPKAAGGASVTIGQTLLFSVMGKLNGPLVANPSSAIFPATTVGASSANQQITLTNEGIAALTINSLVLGGVNLADFVADDGCGAGTVLAVNASCSFNVQFSPTAAGSRTASITVNHTGRNSGFKIALNGIGQQTAGAAISVFPDTFTFADLHTGQRSQSLAVEVSNKGGLAPLVLGTPTADSAQFQVDLANSTCPVAPDAVDIDGSCLIKVRFTPTVGGASTGTISIPSNAGGADLLSNPTITTVSVSGRGFAGSPAVSAAIRSSDGFPEWYQDGNGVRVEPCLNAADTNCIVLADAGFDPSQPLDFPTNFPGEFFYQIADSDLITTPGCGGTAPGTAHLRMALEGAFANGVPEIGQQINFARIRIVVTRGLCANTAYTFTTPYGLVGPFLTNSVGGIPANAGTTDINPPIPSAFMSSGFLRWDPAVAPAAPAGYLGDAISLHPIVGSRYIPAGQTEPANYFAINGTALKTDKFAVSGKLAGPIVSSPASIEFGNQNELTAGPSQTVTLTNVSPDGVSNFVPTLSGPNASDFQITGGTCGAGAIGQDQSCSVTVRFAPGAVTNPSVPKSATLKIAHSGLNSPVTVALNGTAVNVATPAVTLSPTSVAFGSVNVGTTSAAVNVTVRNTGDANLHVSAATLLGTNSGDFVLTNGCALAVIPGGTCTLTVSFAPTANGTRTAQLQLVDDAPTSPQTVNLSGTGVAATLSLSPTSLSFGSIGVGGSSTKSINITNTGTANLTIASFSISGSGTFTVASHNCTAAVAPGKSCSVNIRFAPTSRIAFAGTLNIASNAAGSPHAVALTGTGK